MKNYFATLLIGFSLAYSVSAYSSDAPITLTKVTGGTGLGCYSLCGFFTAQVKIKNLAYDKQVGMVYQLVDSEGKPLDPKLAKWYVATGVFLVPDENDTGSEMWQISFQLGARREYKMEFALYYYVDGVYYWDNNEGKNYFWDNELGILNPIFNVAKVSNKDPSQVLEE